MNVKLSNMLSNLLILSLARTRYAEAGIIGEIWSKKVYYGMTFEIKVGFRLSLKKKTRKKILGNLT